MDPLTPTAAPLPDPPRVSVLCVSRNQAGNLRRALGALPATGIEVIVVDVASSDGTSAIGDDFPEATFLRLPKNFGWTKAANIGLRSTRAELILFLDPRVELGPGAVEALAEAVEAEGPAAVPTLFDPDGAPSAVERALPSPAEIRPAAAAPADPGADAAVAYPGVLALLIRKSFLKGMNFLDERYGEQWADAEIAAQVRRAQRRIVRLAAAQGTLHPELPKRIDAGLLEADWHSGAAVYLKKHFGGGLSHSVGSAFGSLLSGKFGVFQKVASGAKVDGSQE